MYRNVMSVPSFADRPELLLDAWRRARGTAQRDEDDIEDAALALLERRVIQGPQPRSVRRMRHTSSGKNGDHYE